MYWLAADSSDRVIGEDWETYRLRSLAEVGEGFQRLVEATDFQALASGWVSLKKEINSLPDLLSAVAFVAYFVTEEESLELLAKRAQTPVGLHSPTDKLPPKESSHG